MHMTSVRHLENNDEHLMNKARHQTNHIKRYFLSQNLLCFLLSYRCSDIRYISYVKFQLNGVLSRLDRHLEAQVRLVKNPFIGNNVTCAFLGHIRYQAH